MGESTTVRISHKAKVKLEKIALLLGLSIKDALEYAIDLAEKDLDKYQGDLDFLKKILSDKRGSGYTDTSLRVDEVIGEALFMEHRRKEEEE